VTPALLAQHDHVLVVTDPIGPELLRVLVVVALQVACAQAMLGPFVPAERATRVATAGAAGVAGWVLLLLADDLDVPDGAAVLALVGLAVPLVLVVRGTAAPGPAASLRRTAPAVVVLAASAALVELARAVLAGPAAAGPAVHTGLVAGAVGLAWLVLCRVRTRRAAVALHAVAWALALAVLGGGTAVVTAGATA
jgi:hypothetical protein